MLSLKALKSIPTPWTGLPDNIDLSLYAGFVYEIEEIGSGRRYIGKKVFWFHRRHKVKGRKNKKKVTNESDWKYYKGSNDEVLQGIRKQGIKAFRFTIICLCKTRSELNYKETETLFKEAVLHTVLPSGEYAFFNRNIGGKWYRGKV